MSQLLIILDEDKKWARDRIAALDEEIQALGPEFYDVFNQSSETWHDNAPFDALRDRQSVLDAERQQLRRILQMAYPTVPPQWPGQVGIGSIVETADENGQLKKFFIAGDWTANAGRLRRGALVMSVKAPLANLLCGKREGDWVEFGPKKMRVTSVVTYSDDPDMLQ